MENFIQFGVQAAIGKKLHATPFRCREITGGSCPYAFQSALARTNHIANRHAMLSKAPCGAPVLGPNSLMNHRRACSVMGCKMAPVRTILAENSIDLASFHPINTSKAPPAVPIPISPTDSDSEHSTDTSLCESTSSSDSRSEARSPSPSGSPSPNPPFYAHANLQFIEDVAIAGQVEHEDRAVIDGLSVATADLSLLPRAPPPPVLWAMPDCPSLFQVLVDSSGSSWPVSDSPWHHIIFLNLIKFVSCLFMMQTIDLVLFDTATKTLVVPQFCDWGYALAKVTLIFFFVVVFDPFISLCLFTMNA
jgi:hypothetical protein